MNDPHGRRPADCRRFRRNLYHLQAGELQDAEREVFERHAADCPPCAERMLLEDSFGRGLRRRLTRTPAPPGLRARVVEALRAEPAPSPLGGWLRAPWLVPSAAALALALLLIPLLPARSGGGLVRVDRDVTVVDFSCDRAGLDLRRQRGCADPRHLNALKVSATSYWNVSLDDETSRRLVTDPTMRGHRLRVVGELYPAIRTLKITRYTDRGLPAQTAAASRALPLRLASIALPADP